MRRMWSMLVCLIAGSIQAANFVVTQSSDSTATGTLRWAINAAATSPAPPHVISFNLSAPYLITPTSQLSAIGARVTVDGTTQPGFPALIVRVNGGLTTNLSGFNLSGSDVILRGLQIERYSTAVSTLFTTNAHVQRCTIISNGIGITVGSQSSNVVIGGLANTNRNIISGNSRGIAINDPVSSNIVIYGNYIGVDATGTNLLGNELEGIYVAAGRGIDIGFTGSARNVISGNGLYGVYLITTNVVGVRLRNNYIGSDATGFRAISNGSSGVRISAARDVEVGNSASPNLISGNNGPGVLIEAPAHGVEISGNLIGTDAAGTGRLPNATSGVLIHGYSNTISGNTLSGNNGAGISLYSGASDNTVIANRIGLAATGSAVVANLGAGVEIASSALRNRIGFSIFRNIISGNGGDGVLIASGSASNTVASNYIGTDFNGVYAVPNGGHGVQVIDSPFNTIGDAAGPNLISGNASNGVHIQGALATGNRVEHNFVGVNITGTTAVANGRDGVGLLGTIGNNVGPGRNIISGNARDGIRLSANSQSNRIEGNLIGLSTNGTSRLPNVGDGVYVTNAQANSIGGILITNRNYISGNHGSGVVLAGEPAVQNVVAGNYIGTAVNGSSAASNRLGGIRIDGARSNVIGSSSAFGLNLVSGNGSQGILLTGSAAYNRVEGNFIGTDLSGTLSLANRGPGILLAAGASQNTIGGTATGTANRVGFNLGAGVLVTNLTSVSNAVLGNLLYGNAGPPIDLGGDGVTTNDPAPDADVGPNNLQNAPVVTNALQGSTLLKGYLVGVPLASYRLEFFAEGSPGMLFVGTTNLVLPAGGTQTFSYAFGVSAPTTWVVKGTASLNGQETSELGPGITSAPLSGDSDGDLMPDNWEIFHGLNPAISNAPTDDADFDGVPDVAEWFADTVPDNAGSYFRITALSNGAPRHISFLTSGSRSYYVDGALDPGQPVWVNVYTNLAGTGGEVTVLDGSNANVRVYRAGVWKP